jgi:hypothetical protein
MAIVKTSEEITTIVYTDDTAEVYRRNNINSPLKTSGPVVIRWLSWIDVLEQAEQCESLDEVLRHIELITNLTKSERKV